MERLTPEVIQNLNMPDAENQFFTALLEQAGDIEISINYHNHIYTIYGIYDRMIARLAITKIPRCFAVYKTGADRATKLFDTKEDAEKFIADRGDGYVIQIRYYMDHTELYVRGKHDRDRYTQADPSLSDCTAMIPKIISIAKSYMVDETYYDRQLETKNLKDYTVIDTETTGLEAYKKEIIEISAIRVRGGVMRERFTSFVKPTESISAEITKLTGITNQMVQNAPSPEEVDKRFTEFIGNDILIGHNIGFDLQFIGTNFHSLENKYVDTLKLARDNLYLERYRLIDVATYFGVAPQRQHRSMDDCETVYRIYERMKNARSKTSSTPQLKTYADTSTQKCDRICRRCNIIYSYKTQVCEQCGGKLELYDDVAKAVDKAANKKSFWQKVLDWFKK